MGGPALFEVQRDGPVQLPAPAAVGGGHGQELRGSFACRLHGRQWRRDAWQGHLLRAKGGGLRRWQEEVSQSSTLAFSAVLPRLHIFGVLMVSGAQGSATSCTAI